MNSIIVYKTLGHYESKIIKKKEPTASKLRLYHLSEKKTELLYPGLGFMGLGSLRDSPVWPKINLFLTKKSILFRQWLVEPTPGTQDSNEVVK